MSSRGKPGVATRGSSRGGATDMTERRAEADYERFLHDLINVDANLGLAGWTAERPWEDFSSTSFGCQK